MPQNKNNTCSKCSKPKISFKVYFASAAEAKKAGKASRRSEETPKPLLAAGRTACKNWYHPFSH